MSTTPTSWSAVAWPAAATVSAALPAVPGVDVPPRSAPGSQPYRPPRTTVGSVTGAASDRTAVVPPLAACTP
jgi:hypothetical protein